MLNTNGVFSWARRVLRNLWFKILLIFRQWYRLEGKYSGVVRLVQANPVSRKQRQAEVEHPVPTARGLPVVGTFFELMAAGASGLHKYIDRRHQQLGPIFRERLGGGTQVAVFVSSASLMRSVFLHEGQHPRHPLPAAWTLYNREHNCQRGLFFMEGAEWLHNRRLLNRFLLNGNLEWTQPYIDACTENLVSNWKGQLARGAADDDGYCAVLNLEHQLYRWSIDVICAIMFGNSVGLECSHVQIALDDFATIVHSIFESSSALMNFPPQLAKMLNLKIWTDFERNVGEVLHKGFEIIDLFLQLENHDTVISESNNPSEPNGALLHKLQAAGMPLGMIKRIFVDLVIAAGDTTAYSSEWALYLISQDCDLQRKLAKHVLNAVENDVPLVRGLMKETLRLYPVAPFIGRYLACDATIGGYKISKDTLVLLSLYTAGRDPEHFPEPLAVKPERWQRNEETGELKGVLQAHGTLPFAIGIRSCIGRKIALNQMQSIISALVSNFQLKCINTEPIDCQLRLVTVPTPAVQLAFKSRNIV